MCVDFCHLHAHTEYSLLDGASRIKDVVKRAQQLGQRALAITDHGNMFGAIEFYNACRSATAAAKAEGKPGIKPIIGMEAYVVPGGESREKREKIEGQYDHHCLLWASDFEGYKNLMKLSSAAYVEGFYMHPRIDMDILAKYSKGLIGSSGCLGSEVPYTILRKDYKTARNIAAQYIEILGKDNFYFELQNQCGALDSATMSEDARELYQLQNTVNKGIIKIAKELGGKLIATNDSHYTTRDDAGAHDALLCIGTGKLLSDTNRMRFACNEFYLKSNEEMLALFPDYPEALSNTLEIAERCNVEIPFDEYHLPKFPIPGKTDPDAFFKAEIEKGMLERYGKDMSKAARERVDEEVRVLIKMGFVGYLLIVWDIIREARERKIPVGPGRGSAAGSIVCYALNITNIDPLKYNLLFERFVNEGRNEMPDIDIDFCQTRRPEIIEYVQDKYGRDCTAGIITFNSMAAKGSLRDLGRVMDYPLQEVSEITKLIPTAPKVTLQPRVSEGGGIHAIDDEPDLKAKYQTDSRAKELIDMARRIEGLTRNPGRHAAGLVIADRDITEYCPLYRDKDGILLTQYEMSHIDAVGMLKVDFLGLVELTKLYLARDMIKERHGIDLSLDEIPIDDETTYKMLARGEAKGIFQFESDGMIKLLMEARPDRLEDLIALNAMFRPGPMENIPTFINRKHGLEPIEYLTPQLEEILKDTYGIIVYQEQVMQIANQLGGFSLSDADRLRKAMGKKKLDLMEKYGVQFVEGCKKLDIPEEKSTALYALISKFAEYGFNKSHAAAYAFVAYQGAYVKANFTPEYMAAQLTLEQGSSEKVVEYIEESRRIGLDLAGPDVNKSTTKFGIEEDGKILRFALSAIKGVGTRAVENIVEVREKEGPFKDLFDFCERIDSHAVNKGALESLIKGGAFDDLGGIEGRGRMVAAMEDALAAGATIRKDRASGQGSLFGEMPDDEAASPQLPNVPDWPDDKRLEEEKKVLGFYFSGHPLADVRELVEGLSSRSCKGLQSVTDGYEVILGAYINVVDLKITRNKGQRMAILNVEDFTGTAQVVVFPRTYEKFKHMIEPDKIMFFRGKLKLGEGAGSVISILVEELFSVDEAVTRYLNEVHIFIRQERMFSTSPGGQPEKFGAGKSGKKKTKKAKPDKPLTKEAEATQWKAVGARMESVASLLAEHPGKLPVWFMVEFEGSTGTPVSVVIRADHKYRVQANADLFSALHEMLPHGSVLVKGSGNKPRPAAAPRWQKQGSFAGNS